MKYTFLFSVLLIAVNSIAQSPEKITALKPGDKIPDIVLHIDNYKKKQVRLSELEGKVVILDFWSTWCSSCIQGFTKMERFKEYFKDKIEVILVNTKGTRDTPEKIMKAFKKREETVQRPVILPYINEDTLLEQLFPWQYLPQIVIIDRNGRLVSVGFPAELLDKDIADIISGNIPVIATRNNLVKYDASKPLFFGGNGQAINPAPPFIYQSFLTKEMPGLMGQGGMELPDGSKRVFGYNVRLADLYGMFSFAKANLYLPSSCIEWDVPPGFNKEWLTGNFRVCYELIGPPDISFNTLYAYAMTDLFERAFPFTASNEKKIKKVIVLKSTPALSRHTAIAKEYEMMVDRKALHKFGTNMKTGQLTYFLSDINTALPVVDETGLQFNLDLDFPADIYEYNTAQLLEWLTKTGFDAQIAERKVDILKISAPVKQ